MEQLFAKRVGEVSSWIFLYDIIFSAFMSSCFIYVIYYVGTDSSAEVTGLIYLKRGRICKKSCLSLHFIFLLRNSHADIFHNLNHDIDTNIPIFVLL